MAEQKLIKKYNGIISEVQTEIKKLENDTRVLNKLYVILDVLHDEPISEIIKKHDISQGTAYNWIKQWNNGGIEGLKRKNDPSDFNLGYLTAINDLYIRINKKCDTQRES